MIVKVTDLQKSYGRKVVVEEMSFTAKSHFAIGIIGQDGCGKTSVMRMLATLDVPNAGDITIDGVSIVDHPFRARKKIGFMSQQLPELRDLTVWQYLGFYARAYMLSPKKRKSAMTAVETLMNLRNLRSKTLYELQNVERRRLALASAILHEPVMLVLDEPTSGLDIATQQNFIELLKILKDTGKTIVASAKALTDLGDLCDGALILNNGKVNRVGTFETIAQDDVDHREITVRLSGENQDALVEALKKLPKIWRVEAGENNIIRARMNANEEECARVLSQLVAMGLDVAEFKQKLLESDEIFDDMEGGPR